MKPSENLTDSKGVVGKVVEGKARSYDDIHSELRDNIIEAFGLTPSLISEYHKAQRQNRFTVNFSVRFMGDLTDSLVIYEIV